MVLNVLKKEISENTDPMIRHHITEDLNALPALTSGSMSLNKLSLQETCFHFPYKMQFYLIGSITPPAQMSSQICIFIMMSTEGIQNINVHLTA